MSGRRTTETESPKLEDSGGRKGTWEGGTEGGRVGEGRVGLDWPGQGSEVKWDDTRFREPLDRVGSGSSGWDGPVAQTQPGGGRGILTLYIRGGEDRPHVSRPSCPTVTGPWRENSPFHPTLQVTDLVSLPQPLRTGQGLRPLPACLPRPLRSYECTGSRPLGTGEGRPSSINSTLLHLPSLPPPPSLAGPPRSVICLT